MITDPPAEALEAQFIAAGKALADRLAHEPSTMTELREIIDAELSSPATSETWGSLGRRLTDYLDEVSGNLLVNMLTVPDLSASLKDAGFPEMLADVNALERSLAFLRALYKERLQFLQRASGESPDDWDIVTREVSYDALVSAWQYRVRIEKYGGEIVSLVGPVGSIVALTTRFLDLIRQFPGPWVVEASRIEELNSMLQSFAAWLKTQDSSGVPEQTPAAAAARAEPGVSPTAPPLPRRRARRP
jgi:hypothetical protein